MDTKDLVVAIIGDAGIDYELLFEFGLWVKCLIAAYEEAADDEPRRISQY
jgi:hypothetical protein